MQLSSRGAWDWPASRLQACESCAKCAARVCCILDSCCVVHPRQLLHVNSSIVNYRYCNHADLSPRHASLLLGRVSFTSVSFSWVPCAPAACRCCTTAVTRRVAALSAERVTRCAAGMTNTAGAIPGIIGVVTTGAILDQTGSWPLALFVPSIFFFVTGAGC